MDHLSRLERSELMSRIRGKNTTPEMIVRRFVWAAGYRYRLHDKHLHGSPDLVFSTKKKVVFVNGCFWHGHKCRKGKLPKTRTEFWKRKIERNKKRDSSCVRKLRREGWSSLIIWECETKNPRRMRKLLESLEK